MDVALRRVVPVAALALLATPAVAQTGPDLLLKPFSRDDQFELNADWLIGFPTETDNRDAAGDVYDLRVDFVRLAARQRLTPGQSDEGIARAQPRAGLSVDTLALNTLDPAVPTRVYDASLAAGMGIFDINGWQGGVTFGVGNAVGDDLLENDGSDGNGLYLEANFAVGKTFSNKVDLFGIVVNFDGNRTILPDVPLPGFQYRRKVGDQFVLTAGFPFAGLLWEPNDRFSLDIQYVIPGDFNLRADYRMAGDLFAYGSLAGGTVAAHWDGLDRGQDRVFYNYRNGELGISYDADPNRIKFILAVGLSIGQEVNEGWDSRDLDEIADIDDSGYIRTGFELRL